MYTPSFRSKFQHLVVSGCSFTSNEHVPGNTPWAWPNILAQETGMTVHNLATAGAGNTHISVSIRTYLARHRQLTPSNTLVLVMWSGVGRIDFTASSHCVPRPASGGAAENCFLAPHVQTCIGGHWWNTRFPTVAHSVIRDLARLQDDHSLALQSWLEISALQDYLSQRGFVYRCTSFVNYRQNLIKGDALVVPFLTCLSDLGVELDQSQWLELADSDHYGDWARVHNLLTQDGFHPGQDAPQRWPREVLVPVLLSQGIIVNDLSL